MGNPISTDLSNQQNTAIGNTGVSFIDTTIPDKDKDENYHKQAVFSLVSRTLNSSFEADYALLDQCYRYFDGSQGGDQFKYLQEAEDGSTLPAAWMNLNKIRVKLKVLLGELMEKGYDFDVKALNKEAISRKLKEKERLLVEMRLKPFAQDLEAHTGIPTTVDPQAPDSEEDLDEFFDKSYKEISETVMYYALKFLDKRNMWGAKTRYKLFTDLLIAGKCFAKNEIVNGIPQVRRIDPRFMVYDIFSEDDFLSDSTYFGEVRYMNIADAAVKYNLSKKELKEAYKSYTDFLRIRATKSLRTAPINDYQGFDSLGPDSTQRWFKQTPNGLRVLVVEGCWVDYKDYKHKVSVDAFGNEHLKRTDKSTKDNIISKKIKVWRGATVIGGKFVRDWGELPNQPRDLESLHTTEPPYVALIPDFLSGQAVSLVMQLKSLQNLKDIITYNTSLAMARAGAKGFVYDVSQCPDGWDVGTVVKYLKTVGIAFINSKQGGSPSTFNTFNPIDLSLSESVRQYLELSMMVDKEMDSISGISEARQGIVQGASQAVGVTRSALLQSSLATASYFHLFDAYTSKIWNHQAKLVKISWVNKDKFAPIIGDAGVDFLKEDVDLDLNDYGVFVEATPRALDDLNNFQQLIMAALQAGQIEFADAMNLLVEKDVRSAIRKFEKISAKKKKEAFDQQRQLQAEQAQQQMAAQERMLQNQTQNQQIGAQNAQAIQAAKTQGDITTKVVAQRGEARLIQLQGMIEKELQSHRQEHEKSLPPKQPKK